MVDAYSFMEGVLTAGKGVVSYCDEKSLRAIYGELTLKDKNRLDSDLIEHASSFLDEIKKSVGDQVFTELNNDPYQVVKLGGGVELVDKLISMGESIQQFYEKPVDLDLSSYNIGFNSLCNILDKATSGIASILDNNKTSGLFGGFAKLLASALKIVDDVDKLSKIVTVINEAKDYVKIHQNSWFCSSFLSPSAAAKATISIK